VLSFDTATRATTVALLDSVGGDPIAARDDPEPGERPRHTTLLMALIADVLDRAGYGWDDLDRIAVGVGPGTFTGLRIGVATARALARAREIDLVGVSTLRALALGAAAEARERSCDAVLAVLDARRGEVFAAAWTPDGAGARSAEERLLEPCAVSPQELAKRAASIGSTRLAIGDGALAFRGVLERSGTAIADDRSRLHRVDAIFTAQLALDLDPVGVGEVRPEYLRVPDAELSLQAAQRR
jgi:tRNA threonylcarbamoyladenosine biosynthesis protein TsaB